MVYGLQNDFIEGITVLITRVYQKIWRESASQAKA